MTRATFTAPHGGITIPVRRRTIARADWLALCRILGPVEARYAMRRAGIRVAA